MTQEINITEVVATSPEFRAWLKAAQIRDARERTPLSQWPYTGDRPYVRYERPVYTHYSEAEMVAEFLRR